MIYGIGTDITEVGRFAKWIKDPSMIARFYNENEILKIGSESFLCQHYAVRFAAKEAFSKALGTGIAGFELHDVYIANDKEGNRSCWYRERLQLCLKKGVEKMQKCMYLSVMKKNLQLHLSL
ncbi:MAG: holo-ACP synthase [Treponema sp.]